ncbi:sensor domain-containing diguanylate cyclase [Gayadomonas joobiniege]|uniref:sensor domain-containing diguanylate cyclase n=1 Tax=Gayadomonas joobiniege TaxID=1234606 RepID=UPI000361562D|nr:diguanylate cyclase [Gayadomonas joobiniege]
MISRLEQGLYIAFCLFAILGVTKLQAEPIFVNEQPVELRQFPTQYYVDNSLQMPLSRVMFQTFQADDNQIALGIDNRRVWNRMQICNTSTQPRTLYLHHPFAYHTEQIEFFQLENEQIIRQYYLNMDQPETFEFLVGEVAVFSFILSPDTCSQLYLQTQTYSHQWFKLDIFDQKHSLSALVGSRTDIALLVGMLMALIIYNFLLYISARQRENIFYSLYLISGAVWIALSYGLFANFFGWVGLAVMQLHMSLVCMPIFLILFMMSIFETRQNYAIEHKALMFMLTLLLLELVYSVFDIIGAMKIASSLAALMMLVTISVSISLWRKGNPLAPLFLIGHILFVIFNGLSVLYYKGILDFHYITCYGVGIGITLEALMLAFILSYRLKILEGLKESQEKLKQQASTDAMTNLYNRRYFNDNAASQIKASLAKQQPVCILLLDIDKFKRINDGYGHQTGDEVIVDCAQTILNNLRASDLAARFGGEEFILLLPSCPLAQAEQIAQKIRNSVKQNKIVSFVGHELTYTVSIGITQITELTAGSSVEDFIHQADKALYQAKEQGRDRICCYSANDALMEIAGARI